MTLLPSNCLLNKKKIKINEMNSKGPNRPIEIQVHFMQDMSDSIHKI